MFLNTKYAALIIHNFYCCVGDSWLSVSFGGGVSELAHQTEWLDHTLRGLKKPPNFEWCEAFEHHHLAEEEQFEWASPIDVTPTRWLDD